MQADIERVREVYDAFLAEFPLCYGYWKKYADAEARWGTLEHAAHVYERGVASIPYSIDLWGHYAMFKQNQGASHEEMQGCASQLKQSACSGIFALLHFDDLSLLAHYLPKLSVLLHLLHLPPHALAHALLMRCLSTHVARSMLCVTTGSIAATGARSQQGTSGIRNTWCSTNVTLSGAGCCHVGSALCSALDFAPDQGHSLHVQLLVWIQSLTLVCLQDVQPTECWCCDLLREPTDRSGRAEYD